MNMLKKCINAHRGVRVSGKKEVSLSSLNWEGYGLYSHIEFGIIAMSS
jgi:hypothetical protein